MYHCDNTSGWLPFSFMYVRGERTISKREEVYHETESRMRVHYGTERRWKFTMGQKERGWTMGQKNEGAL